MSPSRARKSNARFNPFLAGLLVLLAIIGVAATLELTGVARLGLGKLFNRNEAVAANMVHVLLPNRVLEPGHMLGRGDLWDPKAGRLRLMPMERPLVEEGHFATGVDQIRGRVLAKSKSPNDPFQPGDFLPKGSPAGLVGLVPSGMRLVPVPVDKVSGLEALGYQDHFDLYVNDAISQKLLETARKLLAAREHVSDEDQLRLAQAESTLRQRLLAQNGSVLRQADPSSKSKERKVSVALHPDDVEALLAALDDGSTIYCIARSPEEARQTERVSVAAPDPMEVLSWVYEDRSDVEFISGSDRQIVSIPKARN